MTQDYHSSRIDDEREAELPLLLVATTAVVALGAGALGYALWWLAGQPPVFWRRVAAVLVAIAGAWLIGLALAAMERGRR